jgi:AMP phosphorylase
MVRSIKNKSISRLAHLLGAPKDKKAGIYLKVHKNNKVKKGDPLFTLYSESKTKLDNAVESLKKLTLAKISN